MKRKLMTTAVFAAFVLFAAGCTDSTNVSSAPSEPSVSSEQTSTSPADTSAAESSTTAETQSTVPAEPTEITAPTEEADNSTEAAASPTEEVITIVTTEEAEPDFPVGCTVSAAWADDFLEQSSSADYIEAVADGGEVAARVLFTTDGAVRDFTVLALTSPEIDDNGNISFESTPVCEVELLTADTPLVVVMSFLGDIPNYGVSYDNGTGEIQRFTVSESGYDGSLILSAF
ncbi:MAG: hypothetical protein ACI4Q4_02605 [Oscillospiraceae bacterium]